jgi:hypothetical protein
MDDKQEATSEETTPTETEGKPELDLDHAATSDTIEVTEVRSLRELIDRVTGRRGSPGKKIRAWLRSGLSRSLHWWGKWR